MAGIFGSVGVGGAAFLSAMGERLAHRGGRCHVAQVEANVSLGCVGHELELPIASAPPLTLVADAALFNREALRPSSRAETTAGLLLQLYAQAGVAGIAEVNGDFAFALWDDREGSLVLARDYVGAQPLYYASLPGGGVLFASEYKAILAADSFTPEVDRDMLQCLQHHKQLPSQRTLLANVRAVPPGTLLHLRPDGTPLRAEHLPTIGLAVERLPETRHRDRVAKSFLEAVRLRMEALPRVGVALSGGIDSIGVACAMRRLAPDAALHTYTAGHGPDDPEMRTAAITAAVLGTTHHPIVVAPEMIAERLPQLVWHLEDPIARTETVQLFEIGREARREVDALLTGLSADGLFAGMPKHKLLWLMQKLPPLKRPLTEFYHLTQSGVRPSGLTGKVLDRVYFRGKLPDVPAVRGADYRPAPPAFPGLGPEFINEVLAGGFQEGTARWIQKVERTCAAAGLRYCSPFFDPDLIRTAFTVPSNLKIRNRREKYIMRRALAELVPPELVNVPKFPMKMKHDLAFSEALDSLADRYLSRERLERRGFFEFGEIQKLRRREPGRAYGSEGGMRVWTALLTELWAEIFLDNRGAPPPGSAAGTAGDAVLEREGAANV